MVEHTAPWASNYELMISKTVQERSDVCAGYGGFRSGVSNCVGYGNPVSASHHRPTSRDAAKMAIGGLSVRPMKSLNVDSARHHESKHRAREIISVRELTSDAHSRSSQYPRVNVNGPECRLAGPQAVNSAFAASGAKACMSGEKFEHFRRTCAAFSDYNSPKSMTRPCARGLGSGYKYATGSVVLVGHRNEKKDYETNTARVHCGAKEFHARIANGCVVRA